MKSIHRFWMIGLTSPLIYLVICLLVDRGVFAGRPQPGFWPLAPQTYNLWLVALALAAVAAFPLVLLLKIKWASPAPLSPNEDTTLLESPRGRRFLALFMICDTVAVAGLILFLIQGRMTAMLLFGILGLFNYAAAYPGESKENAERGTKNAER